MKKTAHCAPWRGTTKKRPWVRVGEVNANRLCLYRKQTSSEDVDGLEIATSDKSRGAVPKIGTSARVIGGAGEERRVNFAPSPRMIPDAWFQLQSEGAHFPSREEEEQLRSKLQGFTE